MRLAPGFYWVQLASEKPDTWEIARRQSDGRNGRGQWTILNWDQTCEDDAFRCVDPRPIVRAGS